MNYFFDISVFIFIIITDPSIKMTRTFTFKVLTAGDGGVGKTTLIHRFIEGRFLKDTKMTIGVDFFIKAISLGDDKELKLSIWDFGGEDRFKKILRGYVSGAHGALLMFDLTRPTSFYNIEDWLPILRSQDKNLPILLLGTKIDLDQYVAVDDKDVALLVNKHGFIDFMKISSKTGLNVEASFERIAESIFKRLKKR